MKSKADPCIFCDEAPCSCNQSKTRNSARGANSRKADKSDITDKPDTSDLELRSPSLAKKPASFLDAMKTAAQNSPALPPPPPREEPKKRFPTKGAYQGGRPASEMKPPVNHKKPHVPEVPDEELVMNAAIRNLAPLLHPNEQERYAAIISSKPHPHERRAIWKMRRRENGQAV